MYDSGGAFEADSGGRDDEISEALKEPLWKSMRLSERRMAQWKVEHTLQLKRPILSNLRDIRSRRKSIRQGTTVKDPEHTLGRIQIRKEIPSS